MAVTYPKCPNCNQSDEVIPIRNNVFECERCKVEFWVAKVAEESGKQEATNAD